MKLSDAIDGYVIAVRADRAAQSRLAFWDEQLGHCDLRDIDLLPKKVTKTRERFPAKLTHGRSQDEEQAIYRRADHWFFEGA